MHAVFPSFTKLVRHKRRYQLQSGETFFSLKHMDLIIPDVWWDWQQGVDFPFVLSAFCSSEETFFFLCCRPQTFSHRRRIQMWWSCEWNNRIKACCHYIQHSTYKTISLCWYKPCCEFRGGFIHFPSSLLSRWKMYQRTFSDSFTALGLIRKWQTAVETKGKAQEINREKKQLHSRTLLETECAVSAVCDHVDHVCELQHVF